MNDLNLEHELTLVREIMTTIGHYNEGHGIAASPGAIRDTLLMVAGLLHREAARLETQQGHPRGLDRTFVEAARRCLEKVLDASGDKRRYSS